MIKRWLRKRKEARKQKDMRRGFLWALECYFLDGMCQTEIESYTTIASNFSGWNNFDLGADAALDMLKQHFPEWYLKKGK